ncbi:hypothetical protein Tco_0668972, partial [Tanacetum coccineum]
YGKTIRFSEPGEQTGGPIIALGAATAIWGPPLFKGPPPGDDIQSRVLELRRRNEKSLDSNNSFLVEYECSSLALDREERRYEKEEIESLETISNNVSDQEI